MYRRQLAEILRTGSRQPQARRFRQIGYLVIVAAVIDAAAITMPIMQRYESIVAVTAAAIWGFFLIEWLLRIECAPDNAPGLSSWAARKAYALSPFGIIDALCALGPLVVLATGFYAPVVSALLLLPILKAVRAIPGLHLILRVFRNERRTLLSVMTLFGLVLVISAECEYLLESRFQPTAFGSLPAALWWGIVTLTTTGYGDAIPGSFPGRIVAGMVMICGIAVLALFAGILASGFAAEIRRRDFLTAWDMVARIPFLRDLGAATIAEVARLLRPQEVSAGSVVMRRGQPGDCMFFIVSGRLEVQVEPRPVMLGDGDFVGEMALITGEPRTATVTAREHSELLALDLADFRELAGRHPELAKAIEKEAAKRSGSNKAKSSAPD
jgi:voltage-gated potassium channel